MVVCQAPAPHLKYIPTLNGHPRIERVLRHEKIVRGQATPDFATGCSPFSSGL